EGLPYRFSSFQRRLFFHPLDLGQRGYDRRAAQDRDFDFDDLTFLQGLVGDKTKPSFADILSTPLHIPLTSFPLGERGADFKGDRLRKRVTRMSLYVTVHFIYQDSCPLKKNKPGSNKTDSSIEK